jgi:hypothetical protein
MKLSFQPLKGKQAIGAATPIFTPMLPAGTSERNFGVAAPLDVKIGAELPRELRER